MWNTYKWNYLMVTPHSVSFYMWPVKEIDLDLYSWHLNPECGSWEDLVNVCEIDKYLLLRQTETAIVVRVETK